MHLYSAYCSSHCHSTVLRSSFSLLLSGEFVHARAYESHTHNHTYLYITVLITGNRMPSVDHG